MATLADAVEDISDAILEAITAATVSGGPLVDVETVVRGDRVRPTPKLPAVAAVPQPAIADQDTYGAIDAWRMPVRLLGIVKAADPEPGGIAASRLAATAMRIVLADRTLGLGFVIDCKPSSFDGMSRPVSNDNRNLFYAEAVLEVWFVIDWNEEGS